MNTVFYKCTIYDPNVTQDLCQPNYNKELQFDKGLFNNIFYLQKICRVKSIGGMTIININKF